MPYYVVTCDLVKVDYVDPNTGTPGSREFKITKTADGKITATDINSGAEQNTQKTTQSKEFMYRWRPGRSPKV